MTTEEIEELRNRSIDACIRIYLRTHVSELSRKPDYIREAYSIGRELYFELNPEDYLLPTEEELRMVWRTTTINERFEVIKEEVLDIPPLNQIKDK